MAFDIANIPLKLRDAYLKKQCGILVGAGVSASAGLPLWGSLLQGMVLAAQQHSVISDEKAAQYSQLVGKPDKYLAVASGLKDDLGVYFDEFIETTFVGSKPAPTDLHAAIVALEKLQFVITTNYDTLVERAYRNENPDVSVCTFRDTGEIQRRLAKREFFILKAHGDAAKVTNGIILTDGDYRDLLFRHRGYQSLMSAMFTMFTIVFVGTSMADPEIKLLLNYIADAFMPSSGPSHFAVLAKEDINDVEKDRWFKDFNIQVIPVSKANDYEELKEFIVALSCID